VGRMSAGWRRDVPTGRLPFRTAVSEVTLRLWRNTAFASRDLSESLGG